MVTRKRPHQNVSKNFEETACQSKQLEIFFRSYLGMTAHWINPDTLEREQRMLACKRLIGKHTYNNLAKVIQEIHLTFGISDKVVGTTTDNGSNFVKAFK